MPFSLGPYDEFAPWEAIDESQASGASQAIPGPSEAQEL
jgi:hypothetical protein